MCLLSYNSNGLRNMSIEEAIRNVAGTGFDGIELSLHKNHLHPYRVSQNTLDQIKRTIDENNIKVACLATGCADLLSDVPYEPSLISEKAEDRSARINLIRESVNIAKYLEIPVVNFASGILQHQVEPDKARAYLIEGINLCLENAGNVVLAIEPEPGMFVETTTQAISVIEEINSPQLELNLDIGHVYCCEDNYLEKIQVALKHSAHIHVEDIKDKVHHHEIPGTGEIDFGAFIKLCRSAGYEKYLSVELYHHAPVWQEALKKSKAFLTEILKEY